MSWCQIRKESSAQLLYALMLLLPCMAQAKPTLSSPEGTFSLIGGDSLPTIHFSRTLAGFEKQFYQVTGFTAGETPPIVIVLHDATDAGNVNKGQAVLRVDSVDRAMLRIQVDIPAAVLGSPTTSATLAQAMLIRQYYNGATPASGSRIPEFPAWLLHGLGKLSDPETKLAVIPSSYLRGATPPSIADLLVQKAPDSSNSALLDVYDTMAADLISAGLKSGGGEQALRAWIGRFHSDSPDHPASSWPPGWSMQSVERRWLLIMAGNEGEEIGSISMLGVGETLARYDGILAEVSTPNHSLALLKKAKGSDYLIQQLSSRLLALRLQANPIADPLLDEMILLCSKFKHLSEKKIAEKEKILALLRADILKRSHAIEDYLDWFEAAKLPVRSGLFDRLLKTPDSPVQKGPIGHYLDTIESRGW